MSEKEQLYKQVAGIPIGILAKELALDLEEALNCLINISPNRKQLIEAGLQNAKKQKEIGIGL